MKHFKTGEWIDFVNQVMPEEQRESMKAHLAGGCKSCSGQFETWNKVRKLAAGEPAYRPPDQAVGVAKALFADASWGKAATKPGLVELLFDTFLQPALAGARAAGTGVRQMLFRAGAYQIDLQIEAKPGSSIVLITGQVLDVSRPETRRSGLHVVLGSRWGNTLHTVTNEFGEFHVEVQNSGDLDLTLSTDEERPIVISLGNPMDDSPAGRN